MGSDPKPLALDYPHHRKVRLKANQVNLFKGSEWGEPVEIVLTNNSECHLFGIVYFDKSSGLLNVLLKRAACRRVDEFEAFSVKGVVNNNKGLHSKDLEVSYRLEPGTEVNVLLTEVKYPRVRQFVFLYDKELMPKPLKVVFAQLLSFQGGDEELLPELSD